MDNDRSPTPEDALQSWAPRSAAVIAVAVIGLGFGVVAATAVTDVPGRFLAGIASVGLLIFAFVSWRARPKLALTRNGLLLGGVSGPKFLLSADIESVKLTEFRRIGRRTRILEIEAHDRLIVLNRWDLGTDPREVFQALRDARYPV